jgi:hypothetical protein
VVVALDGETVLCKDGSRVRFIGVGSPLGADPGAAWATAVTTWFLAGRRITLETDVEKFDQFGSRWAYPHWTGNDGQDYNISVLLIYIGMAGHYREGANAAHIEWFDAAQAWAKAACWNLYAPGNPWQHAGACA